MRRKDIPQLRFKDFDDIWESTKLGKIGKTQSGVGFSESEQGGDFGIPFYKVSDMNNSGNEYQMSNANNYVTDEQVNRKKWKVIDELPAVIFAKVGAAIMLDRKRLVKEPFLIDNNMMAYIFDDHWDTQFGKTLFDTLRLSAFAQTGALPSFNGSDIEGIKVSIPIYSEQSAIGSLFQTLDELLSAYKDNLANYQALKASMLSKMFPKAGQTTPEIRLDGFDEEWETERADEIFQTFSDKNHPELPVLSATQTSGMVYRDDVGIDIKYEETSLSGYKRVLPEQFVIHLRSFQGGFAQSKIEGITSPAYTIIDFIDKNTHSSNYWAIFFASKNFIKQLETVTYGIRDGKSISFADFSSLKFIYASVKEQQAIGSFFSNLDDLISFYQKKITQLETLKKKLLQDMFI